MSVIDQLGVDVFPVAFPGKFLVWAFPDIGLLKVVRSHSLGEFWKSALHKSMSAKAPGAGEGGERMDNDGAKQ